MNAARFPAAAVSVAMCTFNGERYLRDQLDSIASQTVRPDRLVVFDDASVDSSPEIINEFAADAPFPVELRVNANNVGSSPNFEMAIRACTGDVVILADQDDVWAERKIEVLLDRLTLPDSPVLVFSDATVVDERLSPLHGSLFERVGFSPRERERFRRDPTAVLLRHNVVTGATMAIRSESLEAILPIPRGWVHDAWLALVAAMIGPIAAIDEPLLLYRQHATNLIGAGWNPIDKLRIPRDRYVEGLRDTMAGWDRAIVLAAELAPERVPALERKRSHMRARLALPETRVKRLSPVLKELGAGRYHASGRGLKTAIRDLLLS